MTPQKRNKIIILSAVVILIIAIVILIFSKKQENLSQLPAIVETTAAQKYYQECKSYLGQWQLSVNGIKVNPPQIFCKIQNGNVLLIPNGSLNIQQGDTIIEILDLPRFLNQEYFNSLQLEPKLEVPRTNFNLCISYKPYFATILNFPKGEYYPSGGSNVACSHFNDLTEVKPIGIVVDLSARTYDSLLGINVFLPPSNLSAQNTITLTELGMLQNLPVIYQFWVPIKY